MNQSEILHQQNQAISNLLIEVKDLDQALFWGKPAPEIWSVAENVQHLIQSVKPLNRLFEVPREALLSFGKPENRSRSYDELVHTYHVQLQKGLRTSGIFVPQIPEGLTQTELLEKFENTHTKFIEIISTWTEPDFDAYQIPHPALGNLTVREMLYFTLYHTQHHHAIIKDRIAILSN